MVTAVLSRAKKNADDVINNDIVHPVAILSGKTSIQQAGTCSARAVVPWAVGICIYSKEDGIPFYRFPADAERKVDCCSGS